MTGWLGRVAVAAVAASLAACSGGAAGYARVSGPVPDEVTASLPPDITTADLRLREGCYYYDRDGEIFPVTTLDMIRSGAADQPFCVG